VSSTASAEVVLVAWTHFAPPADAELITANGTAWQTDADGGQALAEFAGRACYQAWHKPNRSTATNAGYLRHILEVGHLSVIEHASATFYITGVSRSLTHELIRHRHFSFSQLSQRYVPAGDAAMVEPDIIAADPELHRVFAAATDASLTAYRELLAGLEGRLATRGAAPVTTTTADRTVPADGTAVADGTALADGAAVADGTALADGAAPADGTAPVVGSSTVRRKQARQAARAVLPNATETRIVVTGNYRAWRHFIAVRATEPADVEIRELAIACLRQLQHIAPNVFGDFVISTLADGTEVAASPYATEG
jgi:thymidylate synthase (FAD)